MGKKLAKRIHDAHGGRLDQGAVDNTISNISDLLAKPRPEPRQMEPMDKDNLLFQPVENWEKSDRRRPGEKLFFYPTKKWKDNYERIDWNE